MNTTVKSATDSTGSEPDEPGSSTSSDTPPEPGMDRFMCHPSADLDLERGDLSADEADRLHHAVVDILPLLDREIDRVGICIVRDDRMSQLHAQWKQTSTTTDVVTFDLSDSSDSPLRVDIAICLDEAMRQAVERSHEPVDELLLYVVHGLLHCCGFDDVDETASSAMHMEEDRLLRSIGWGAVYDTGDDS
ncbi:MAG: rRNA maturation RNase YbeY [Phycisphaerales bacterium]|nr:rRNA maturation RNase YbeY [Phycisphaerales bacterium]